MGAALPWRLRLPLLCVAAGWLGLLAGPVPAAPRTPAGDDEIVESLPVLLGSAREERRLRRTLAQQPSDEATALAAANAYLDLARSQGDARYAGYALGAIAHWASLPLDQTPTRILVMRATTQQFLHDFDGAESLLRSVVARDPSQSQAWITLATLLRVKGRYAESDAACRALGRTGPAFYALACLAENDGLRGRHEPARATFTQLLAEPSVSPPEQAGTRQWLWTSTAEVEELAGRPQQAEAAYKKAIAAERSPYPLLAYADFLLRAQRPAEVPPLLKDEARSDAVLLRLAIAARQQAAGRSNAASPASNPDAEELRQRFEAAAQRPGNPAAHAREEALFALDVEGDAPRALRLARLNLSLQREPIDLWILARAARAARDEAAWAELQALLKTTGLKDARIDALS